MVKGNHIRNYTTGGSFLKEPSQTVYQSTHGTPVHSYIKLSSSKQEKTESDVEEFGKDLDTKPRKQSYIEKFSPKKRKLTLEA